MNLKIKAQRHNENVWRFQSSRILIQDFSDECWWYKCWWHYFEPHRCWWRILVKFSVGHQHSKDFTKNRWTYKNRSTFEEILVWEKNEFWSLLNLEQLKQLEKMFLVVLVEEHLIKLMKRIIKQLSTLGTLLTFLNIFNYQDINHLITLT